MSNQPLQETVIQGRSFKNSFFKKDESLQLPSPDRKAEDNERLESFEQMDASAGHSHMASVIKSFDNSKLTEHTQDKLAELQGLHDFIVDKNDRDAGLLKGDIKVTSSVVKITDGKGGKGQSQYHLDQQKTESSLLRDQKKFDAFVKGASIMTQPENVKPGSPLKGQKIRSRFGGSVELGISSKSFQDQNAKFVALGQAMGRKNSNYDAAATYGTSTNGQSKTQNEQSKNDKQNENKGLQSQDHPRVKAEEVQLIQEGLGSSESNPITNDHSKNNLVEAGANYSHQSGMISHQNSGAFQQLNTKSGIMQVTVQTNAFNSRNYNQPELVTAEAANSPMPQLDKKILGVAVATGISPKRNLEQKDPILIGKNSKIEIIAMNTDDREDNGTQMTPIEVLTSDQKKKELKLKPKQKPNKQNLIWEMSEFQNSPIAKSKRHSSIGSSMNQSQIFSRKNCRTSMDFLPNLTQITQKAMNQKRDIILAKEKSDKDKPQFEFRGFSREKKFNRAATSMSMRAMEPMTNSNETQLIQNLKKQQRRKQAFVIDASGETDPSKLLQTYLDGRPQVSTTSQQQFLGDGNPSLPRHREKSPMAPQKILFEGFNVKKTNLSQKRKSNALDPLGMSQEIHEIGKNIGAGNMDHFNQEHQTSSVKVEVVETWLNETLREAEYFGLPSSFKKRQQGASKALYDYAIDRMSLQKAGIPHEVIDKTYRSLFVNSLGFFNAIQTLVNQFADCQTIKNPESRHQSKGSLISSIWRVYQILMEFCYATNYKAHILDVIDESRQVLRDKQNVFDDLLALEEEKRKAIREQLQSVEEALKAKKVELKEQKDKNTALRADLSQQAMQHESEVQLRMQFEERLNNLHALNRTFNANAEKYKEISEEKQTHIERLQEEMTALKEKLRNEQTERTTQSHKRNNAEDRILTKTNEVNVLKNMLDELDVKYSDAMTEINNQQKHLNRLEKTLKQTSDNLAETNKMYNNAHHNENNLRLKCADMTIEVSKFQLENEQLLERARDAYDARDLAKKAMETQMQQRHQMQLLLTEAQDRKIEAVTQYELRETEINRLNDVIQIKDNELKRLNTEFTEQSRKMKLLDGDMHRLNQRDENNAYEKKILEGQLQNSQQLNTSFKEKNMDLETKFQELVDEHDETTKNYTEKCLEFEALKRQTGDRIKFLEEIQKKNERDLKQLQHDHDEELKKNVRCEEITLKDRQKITLLTNRVTFLECDIKNKAFEVSKLTENQQDLTQKNQDVIIKGDELERSLLQANQDQIFLEKTKQGEYNSLVNEFVTFKREQQVQQMCTEDYLSRIMLMESIQARMDATIHQLEHNVEDLEERLADTTRLLEESRAQGESTYKTLKETMAKKAILEGELKDLKEKYAHQTKTLSSTQKELSKLQGQHEKVVSERDILAQKLEAAEIKILSLERPQVEDMGCGRTIFYDPSSPPQVHEKTINLTDAEGAGTTLVSDHPENQKEAMSLESPKIEESPKILTPKIESPKSIKSDQDPKPEEVVEKQSEKEAKSGPETIEKSQEKGQEHSKERVKEDSKEKVKEEQQSEEKERQGEQVEENKESTKSLEENKSEDKEPKIEKEQKPQFAFALRFQSAQVQCNKMTVEKIEKKLKSKLRVELKDELRIEIKDDLKKEISEEIRAEVKLEFKKKRGQSSESDSSSDQSNLSKDANSMDGEETKTKRGENTEDALSAIRKGEAFPDYDDGTVKGTIEANLNAGSRRSSRRGETAELPERLKKKKTKKESKSKKSSIPSKLYKAIKACDCDCAGHAEILKQLKKCSFKASPTKSEDGRDQNLPTGDVSGDDITVRDKDQAFASKYSQPLSGPSTNFGAEASVISENSPEALNAVDIEQIGGADSRDQQQETFQFDQERSRGFLDAQEALRGDAYDSFGRATNYIGHKFGRQGIQPPNKIMIDYINVNAPFTAFSLTKKRNQQAGINPSISVSMAARSSITRQGNMYAGDQGIKTINTARKNGEQRRNSQNYKAKNTSLIVQGKHTSMFDDQFAKDQRSRGDIRPLIKGAFARKFDN